MIPLSPRAYFECLAGVVIVGLTIGSWIVTLQRDKARAELAALQVQAARSQDALKLAKLYQAQTDAILEDLAKTKPSKDASAAAAVAWAKLQAERAR